MRPCTPNLSGPGANLDPKTIKRDPYNISTWGPSCGQGVAYKDHGIAQDGAKNQRRTLTGGRKHRGSSSDDLEKATAR